MSHYGTTRYGPNQESPQIINIKFNLKVHMPGAVKRPQLYRCKSPPLQDWFPTLYVLSRALGSLLLTEHFLATKITLEQLRGGTEL